MEDGGHFNAFGDLIKTPAKLSRVQRIDLLRRAAQSLQENGEIDGYAAAWLGLALEQHLATGAGLEGLLGIKPPQGCTRTAQRITEAKRHGALLLRLSAAVGGDRKAVQILAGTVACPAHAKPILEELAESKGARSLRAFTRARAAHQG